MSSKGACCSTTDKRKQQSTRLHAVGLLHIHGSSIGKCVGAKQGEDLEMVVGKNDVATAVALQNHMEGVFSVAEHDINHTVLRITETRSRNKTNLADGFNSSVSDVLSQLLGKGVGEATLLPQVVRRVHAKP